MTDSAPVSATDPAAFVADAGPAFDTQAAESQAPPAAPEPVLDIAWEQDTVEGMLTAKGEVLHGFIAINKDSDEWRYTKADLRAIAPPLTRILNRFDVTRAAAGTGDEIALIIGLVGYAGRSISQRRADIIARNGAPAPEPLTGVSPDAPSVDTDSVAWQVGD